MSSGAAMAPLDVFVCLVLNGVAGAFGGVVSSVRDWRVSGVRIVWVGRLLAWAANCRPLIRFIFAPRLSLLFSWSRTLVPVLTSHRMEKFVGQPRTCPPCCFAAAMRTSKAVPVSRRCPLTFVVAVSVHRTTARALGCGKLSGRGGSWPPVAP